MAHSPAFIVYTNIVDFLSIYRKFRVKSKRLNERDLENELLIRQFVRIRCQYQEQERNNLQKTQLKPDRNLDIFILPERSRYIIDSNVGKRFINNLETDKDVDDIMFVHQTPSLKNTQLDRFQAIDKYIETWPFERFSVVMPKHVSIPEHRFATAEEIANATVYQRISAGEDMPLICNDDPPIIWIGGRPGDIIMINRISENTGHANALRIVR